MARTRKPPRIEVVDRQSHHPVDPAELELLARRVLVGARIAPSVNLVLVDDVTIHELNRRFLGHDWPTDVLTFPFEADPGISDDPGGEVVVSVETAVREAERRGVDPRAEVALYVVHGLLHLLGFDDGTEGEAEAMHREALQLLRDFGIDPRGLAEGLVEGEDA